MFRGFKTVIHQFSIAQVRILNTIINFMFLAVFIFLNLFDEGLPHGIVYTADERKKDLYLAAVHSTKYCHLKEHSIYVTNEIH